MGAGDAYQCASNSLFGPLQAEPPHSTTASSPNQKRPSGRYGEAVTTFSDNKSNKRRSYATLVYQAPSVQNVDSGNRVIDCSERDTFEKSKVLQCHAVATGLYHEESVLLNGDNTTFHAPKSRAFIHVEIPDRLSFHEPTQHAQHGPHCVTYQTQESSRNSCKSHQQKQNMNVDIFPASESKVHSKVRKSDAEKSRFL
ncbi:uncharacterized protein LOC108675936 [Hyalella azteca]|uniref:Uncharacterized protein LOC108675936 n=1 Tax=Hyalella azteca TaxID=294128 RepID=A0A8B7P065_HYAAZ|nr:uncharacterized protein LOC108675936 [Hyalella azteca]